MERLSKIGEIPLRTFSFWREISFVQYSIEDEYHESFFSTFLPRIVFHNPRCKVHENVSRLDS